jgi:hypothetical protein
MLAQAVSPGLVRQPPVLLGFVAYAYAYLLPFAILAAVGVWGYRRRTLGRATTAILGWLLGGAVQFVICLGLSPLAPEPWKLAVCFVFGMASSAVAVVVAAICSALAARAHSAPRGV